MKTRRRCRRGNRAWRGFTLIELLVVISMIALLISLLLPSLSGARRTGQRVACMANLRAIGHGVAEYATDNDDWIIGSPFGSGAYLWANQENPDPDTPVAVAFGPCVQYWDFMGALAHMWRAEVWANPGTVPGVTRRFNELRGAKMFLCPANKFLSICYGGPDAGANWIVSYNTQRYQLWPSAYWPAKHGEKPPSNWERPSCGRMGVPANKVFCADGARYIHEVTKVPDYDLSVNGAFGGAFSDTGCYSSYSRSWDRSRAPGNGDTGPIDPRVYAFRHSTAEPPVGARGNTYKLNLLFYDGHADTMGDLEASSPYIWLPKGARYTSVVENMWPDARQHFGITGDINIGP